MQLMGLKLTMVGLRALVQLHLLNVLTSFDNMHPITIFCDKGKFNWRIEICYGMEAWLIKQCGVWKGYMVSYVWGNHFEDAFRLCWTTCPKFSWHLGSFQNNLICKTATQMHMMMRFNARKLIRESKPHRITSEFLSVTLDCDSCKRIFAQSLLFICLSCLCCYLTDNLPHNDWHRQMPRGAGGELRRRLIVLPF